jgi:hypothetical protein
MCQGHFLEPFLGNYRIRKKGGWEGEIYCYFMQDCAIAHTDHCSVNVLNEVFEEQTDKPLGLQT